MTDQQQLEEMKRREGERRAAFSVGQEQASKEQEVTENANLLRELRRAGIDTEDFGWLEAALGPEVAASHAIGNRSPEYEQEIKWGNIGKRMQHVAEQSPGRLCRGERLAIAQGTHRREDKSAQRPLTTDEKRALRGAYEAATNHQSLAAQSRGLKTVGETTVTAKREVTEKAKSLKEKAGGLLD
jgi:hypothetical protein